MAFAKTEVKAIGRYDDAFDAGFFGGAFSDEANCMNGYSTRTFSPSSAESKGA